MFMNYNKILLIVALLLASFIKISAQDYIYGIVTDVKDIPLEGVTCTLISAKDSCYYCHGYNQSQAKANPLLLLL